MTDRSNAVEAGHRYFRTTPERAEKGSALSMIAVEQDAKKAKTDRLKAARLVHEAAEQEAAATLAAAKPVKARRKSPAKAPAA